MIEREKLAAAYASGVMVAGVARDLPGLPLAGRIVSGMGDLGPLHGALVEAETLPGDMVRLWVTDRRGGDTGYVLPGNAGVIVHSVGYGERHNVNSTRKG